MAEHLRGNPIFLGSFPRTFRINLSLPPAERYVALATQYRDKMQALRPVFDDLVKSTLPNIPVRCIHFLAWLCLHKVHSSEETEELRGISQATGIDLYLLICLNTFLDLLMGCTSGAARIKKDHLPTTIMYHFRTLDWAMDPLRELIVKLEFVRDSDPEKVLATTITYVGFVGVLTGVKQGLSASLNYRPVHDTSRNFAYYTQNLLVLLGLRQSISSLIRQCILPPATEGQEPMFATLAEVTAKIPGLPTSAAYFTFCDGQKAVVIEKDYRTASVRSSSSFIIVTNHDEGSSSEIAESRKTLRGLSLDPSNTETMADFIDDSKVRYSCIAAKWNLEARKQKFENEQQNKTPAKEDSQAGESSGSQSSMRLRKKREDEEGEAEAEGSCADLTSDDDSDIAIPQKLLLQWFLTVPVLNQCTHYSAIMDPSKGTIPWGREYEIEQLDDFILFTCPHLQAAFD